MATYRVLTDQELAALLKEGDHAAFTEIYSRYVYTLINHAYNQTRNREEAQDIVHQVFTVLWSKRDTIQLLPNLSGVLYTSVRNIILNQITRKEVQHRYLAKMALFAADGEIVTDHLVRERQLSALIEHEIAALPPKMREVFEMSRKEFKSYKEIAEELNISEQTVSKQISNALKILRGRLGFWIYLMLLFHPK